MKVILILLVILVPIRMAVARRICPNVPHTSAPTICSNVCDTKYLYEHCMDVMRLGGMDLSPSHREEATVYTILTANLTLDAFGDTLDDMRIQIQQNTSLSSPDRDVYKGCMDDYSDASNSLHLVVCPALCNCLFTNLDRYMSSIDSLERCRDRIMWPNIPPLYDKFILDRNKLVMAYLFGKSLAGY
ncbi:unnamed protein product [Alopecurus aequalis]